MKKQNPNPKTVLKGQNKPLKQSLLNLIALVLIAFVTFTVYKPTFENDFTNWDDNKYVLENPMINSLSADNIKQIFTTTSYMGNYHPLTMLSLAVDYHFSVVEPKIETRRFQYTNIELHILNSFLVFAFVYLLFGCVYPAKNKAFIRTMAFIAAGIFAVHTIHVESVSWIAERKDVLYTLFFLASITLYVKYLKSSNPIFYILSLLGFILSLFSKGQAVSLSITLIAIDFFIGRKLIDKKVIVEKIPFVALSAVFGIVAIHAQKLAGAVQMSSSHTLIDKIAFASYGFTQYWIKLLAPLKLSALYPYPLQMEMTYWLYVLPVLAFVGLAIWGIKKSKELTFVILFFTINIVLVLQVFQVGGAIMADRYSYVSSISFCMLISIAYKTVSERFASMQLVVLLTIAAYVGFLSYQTHQRTKVWKDSLTLWDDVLSKYTQSPEAWVNRANYKYEKIKDFQGALYDFNQAVTLKPNLTEALSGRAVIKRNLGDLKGATEDYNKALSLKEDAETYCNRGVCKVNMNDMQGAMADFNKSIQLKPDYYMGYSNRGSAKFKNQDYKGAIDDYNKALELKPNYAEAYSNRAGAKAESNDIQGALADYEKSIYYNPEYASSFYSRGLIKYRYLKDFAGAIKDLDEAIRLNPRTIEAYYIRGLSKHELGKENEAREDFKTAFKAGYQQAGENLK